MIRSVRDIIPQFDIFLLDQFGVLHNGVSALPGATDAVKSLCDAWKIVVVCSNSSQRKELAVSRWTAMGFPQEVEFLTSGDVSREFIFSSSAAKGWSNVFVFGWENPLLTSNFLEGLPLTRVTSVDQADFLLFHGPETCGEHSISLGDTGVLDEIAVQTLTRAASLGLPAVCANVDMKAVSASNVVRFMPGNLAAAYKALGGTVFSFGKPSREFVDMALEKALSKIKAMSSNSSDEYLLLRNGNAGQRSLPKAGVRRLRAVHAGDSLEHDVAGAHASSIDSLLITRHGIHKNELDEEINKNSDGEASPSLLRAVLAVCQKDNAKPPTFILPEFCL